MICMVELSVSSTNKEFMTVSKAYKALEEKADRNVLFIRVAIDNCPRVFQFHDFKTAPIITYLPGNELMGKTVVSLCCCDV